MTELGLKVFLVALALVGVLKLCDLIAGRLTDPRVIVHDPLNGATPAEVEACFKRRHHVEHD